MRLWVSYKPFKTQYENGSNLVRVGQARGQAEKKKQNSASDKEKGGGSTHMEDFTKLNGNKAEKVKIWELWLFLLFSEEKINNVRVANSEKNF